MGVLYSLISLDRFTLGIVAVIGLLHFTLRIANKKLRQLPLPPGPTPWPIVGNISDFPTTHEGRFWARHKQLYGNQHLLRLFQYPTYIFSLGPISSVTAIGTTFIILNDIGAAFELLEKRSATYSNRYETTFGAKMYVTTSISYNAIFSSHKYYRVQIGRFSALLPYGPELKRHRKLLQTYVNTIASMTWIETVEKVEARRLLVKILSEPSDFFHHLRTFVFIHIPFTLD